MCGYPGMQDLSDDFQFGFELVGEVHRGPRWLPRTDGKYSRPISFKTFRMLNAQHIRARLS